MRILFFGTYDVRRHPRVGVLAEGLRDVGSVEECNEPLAVSTEARIAGVRRPWRLITPAVTLLQTWLRLLPRARRAATPDVVVVGYLGILDIHLARWLWRDRPLLLDQLAFASDTARDRRVGGGPMRRLLAWLDRQAVTAADLVLVDTRENLRLLPRDIRSRGLVVPVGASQSWFCPPTARGGRPLRVVFFGLFTPLQGAPTIGRAAHILSDADIEFTLVGSGQELGETRARAGDAARVRWLDWVDSAELPAFVADHDVCLGIFGTSAKAMRVVPNKVYQGAAAGCAIVTSDTPPQRRALGTAAIYVTPGDPHALAEVLRLLAADPTRLWHFRNAAYDRAVAAFTPRAVVAPVMEALMASRRSMAST